MSDSIKSAKNTAGASQPHFARWVAALTAAMCTAIPAAAATGDLEPRIDAEIRRALDFLHHEQFDSALAVSRQLQRTVPDDPAGYLMAANVYETMMRDYRVRLFEQEFATNLEKALQLANAKLRQHPGSARYFFAVGTARGYQAVHRFREGRWLSAVHSGYLSLRYFRQAAAAEPDFVDPLLALALYDFWKSRVLKLGPLGPDVEQALQTLHRVWRRGRFLNADAVYSLQTVYYLLREYDLALEMNDWLYARFPDNPVCLYHRALIMEALGKDAKALEIWERLIGRIEAFIQPSMGFLAESHLHRALILEKLSANGDNGLREQMLRAIELAQHFAEKRDEARELEGPFALFKEIHRRIWLLMKTYRTGS